MIRKVEKTVNPPSTLGNATGTVNVTVPGVITTDVVLAGNAATCLVSDMIIKLAFVSAADTITMQIYNPTIGTIDLPSDTYTFLIFRGNGNMPVLLG